MVESRLTAWPRPHRAFAAIALVFGTVLVLLVPPFQSEDEIPHFLRAYQISDGALVSRQKDINGLDGGLLPYSLHQITSPFTRMFRHTDVKASVDDIRRALRVPLSPRNLYFYTFPATVHYCPTCYLGPCLGIGLGRALGLPPLAMLYLGREANLLVWTLLGFFALRSAPAIARPLLLLLLMPMSLYLAASVSADPSTSGLAALFTALVCKYFQRKSSIGRKAMILLAAVSIFLSVSKYAYLPMLGLLLLIPARNLGGPGKFAMKLSLLAALNVTALLIWVSASSTSLDTRLKNDASAPLQLQWLEQHPTRIPGLILETFRLRGWLYLQSYVGVIGSFDEPVAAPIVVGYVTLLLLACWSCDPQPLLPSPARAAAIVLPVVTLSCLIIALLDYLFWSPPGLFFIDGLNGRYLIPLTPAMFLLLCSAFRRLPPLWRPQPPQSALNLATALICLCICIYLLAAVWNRYYG
ncbi:MAG: DUF2142 domain-containing protein [Tepidisphaeraceae bacterium]